MLQARKKICDRGQQLGVDFQAEVAKLKQAADWEAERHAAQDPALKLPAYFTAKFHAYSEGNLCWDAALEVGLMLRLTFKPGFEQCLLHIKSKHGI